MYVARRCCHELASHPPHIFTMAKVGGKILGEKSGSIPDELAVGRVAYSHNENCNCVEVYSNCCRVIMPDGSVKKIMNYELQG